MNEWGASTFGDPCRECGFVWSLAQGEGDALVAGTPERFTALIGDSTGQQQHPDLEWTAAGYVCHVADSLRVWAERIANVALGDEGPVAEYDQDLLAAARHYETIGIRGALWSLGRAVADWQAALDLALAVEPEPTMVHAELGEMTMLDVIRIRAHDITHHTRDIERSVGRA